jgi:hypothetical protein
LKHQPPIRRGSAHSNESFWWSKRRKSAEADAQLQFGFIAQSEDAVRDRILEALDFAAESTGKEPTLQPPRPGGDDGEVLVVQTPGAQIGQHGDELIVTVKGEESRKIPGQQVRAIYCYGAVQLTAQAVSTCLELGIDVSYFSPAGRFVGMLGGLPASGVDARRGQYRLFELPSVRMQLAREIRVRPSSVATTASRRAFPLRQRASFHGANGVQSNGVARELAAKCRLRALPAGH